MPEKQDVEIGLLIGRNVPAAFQPINVISGNAEEPWAEQYKFGWTVIGLVCKDPMDGSTDTHTVCVNRVTVEREILLDRDIQTRQLDSAKHPVVTATGARNDGA